MKRLVIAALIALPLMGCSGLSAFMNSLGQNALAIQYATMKFIEQAGPPEAQLARANRLCAITDGVDAQLGEGVPLAALREYVLGKLSPNMLPSDRLLALALLDSIVGKLEGEVGADALNPEDLVSVRRVLDNVRDAALC